MNRSFLTTEYVFLALFERGADCTVLHYLDRWGGLSEFLDLVPEIQDERGCTELEAKAAAAFTVQQHRRPSPLTAQQYRARHGRPLYELEIASLKIPPGQPGCWEDTFGRLEGDFPEDIKPAEEPKAPPQWVGDLPW